MQFTSGILIAIEGIDGAGKSTLAHGLFDFLEKRAYPAVLTKEPGGSNLGKHLRLLIQEEEITLDAKAEFLLFAADRAQHMAETIFPALERNNIVISDRMSDSSVVYQGYGRGLALNLIKQINEWIMNGRTADITFYVKVTPEEARHRIQKRGLKLSVYEQQESFVKKLAEGFDELFATRTDVITLDGNLSAVELVNQAGQIVELWIKKNRIS